VLPVGKDYSPNIEQQLLVTESIDDNLIALVVDDSLSARRSLAEFVKDIGYDVLMARDGIDAIEVIEGRKPNIILVDLEMPRMNGLELTSHLRSKSDTKDIPIIMITSRSTEKHRDMADSAGVNAYLTKPFSEDELLENIQNLLLVMN
jgi:chemosensory pili system protein ChpA (sensor histidine kinase/response regulator)